METSRLQVSLKLRPASTSSRVRSVATKVEFPELPLASAQILTIGVLRSYSLVTEIGQNNKGLICYGLQRLGGDGAVRRFSA